MRAKEGLAGSEQALAGFEAAFQSANEDTDYHPMVVATPPEPDYVLRAIKKLFSQPNPPTAIIIEQIVIVPTAITALAQINLKVPR